MNYGLGTKRRLRAALFEFRLLRRRGSPPNRFLRDESPIIPRVLKIFRMLGDMTIAFEQLPAARSLPEGAEPLGDRARDESASVRDFRQLLCDGFGQSDVHSSIFHPIIIMRIRMRIKAFPSPPRPAGREFRQARAAAGVSRAWR